MPSLLRTQVGHISSISSGIRPRHSASFACLVGSAALQSGVFSVCLSLDFNTSVAFECASICDGCSFLSRSRASCQEANDAGCDTAPVALDAELTS